MLVCMIWVARISLLVIDYYSGAESSEVTPVFILTDDGFFVWTNALFCCLLSSISSNLTLPYVYGEAMF